MRKLILTSMAIFGFALLSFSQEPIRKARITTTFGDIVVKLNNDTPLHRDNFIKNVQNGWYDGTLFHRVKDFFMFQGGDPNSINAPAEQVLGTDRCVKIPAEIRPHYFHKKGALAAARQPDGVNPNKESSGCQFFIVKGYKHTDKQLSAMETETYKFSDIAKAYYKAQGGTPFLDTNYTIFGEVIEGMEIIDLISAMPTSKHVVDRPNTDIMMKVEMIN